MNAKALAFLAGSLCLALLAPPRAARAADQEALVKQITALDDAATASYSDGDFDKMKKQLLKAVSLGKGSLASHPIMARVYLHIGVLYVDGMDKRDQGVKYFTKALKIRPDIEVRSNMATKTVMSAFTEAGQEATASATADRETKERTAREALQKEKSEKDSLLLDTAQRIHQLELDVADRDKRIAAAELRE